MGGWTGESLFRMCGRPFFARPHPSTLDGYDGRPIMGPPICAQQWPPTMGVLWLPTSRLGGRPKMGDQSCPRSAPIPDHLDGHIRPPSPSMWAATIRVHFAPLTTPNPVQCSHPNEPTVVAHSPPHGAPTFVQCGRPDKSTMAAHLPPRRTANPVHVGRPVRPKWSATFHLHPRLGGRPKSATPLAVHTSRDMGVQFRPPFGSPFGRPQRQPSPHRWPPTFRPAHVSWAIWLRIMRPDGRANLRPQCGPTYMWGQTKTPTPKGVRAAWRWAVSRKA